MAENSQEGGGFPGPAYYSQGPVPVAVQPGAASLPPGEDGGPVLVRNMVFEDSEFAGTMTVEAFRGKFEWAAGKSKIDCAMRGSVEDHRQSQSQYHRMFIATYQGERAGVVVLKYHDSREPSTDHNGYSGLGCCGYCGMAFLGCMTSENVPSKKCYVDHIAVDGKFRGKGVGKVLLQRADHEARKQGCTSIYLWVTADNRARHLYERQGYTVVDETDTCCIGYCAAGIRHLKRMEKPL